MIFLLFDGITTATGETDSHKGSEGWMKMDSLQWGTGRGVKNDTGGNRMGDSVSFSEVTLTKELDAASAQLFKNSTTGQGKTATIRITATLASGAEEKFMEYILEDAIITGFYHSSNGNRPIETITLNFSTVQFNQVELDVDGKTQGPNRVGYSVSKKKTL
jgi:type VI secretion system secreted protein Hcp